MSYDKIAAEKFHKDLENTPVICPPYHIKQYQVLHKGLSIRPDSTSRRNCPHGFEADERDGVWYGSDYPLGFAGERIQNFRFYMEWSGAVAAFILGMVLLGSIFITGILTVCTWIYNVWVNYFL